MDEEEIFLIAVYCLVLSLWAEYCQPRHPYVRPIEYRAFVFELDSWPEEKQRRMMRCVKFIRSATTTWYLLIRFTVPEIRLLLGYFSLENVQWQRRNRPDPEMVFCFVLCKLSYPHRLFKVSDHFGYSLSYLSSVANDLIEYLVDRYADLLEWHPLLTYAQMQKYAKACKRLAELRGKSAIWGFDDGTFRAFCRPKYRQKFFYSKYRRGHWME